MSQELRKASTAQPTRAWIKTRSVAALATSKATTSPSGPSRRRTRAISRAGSSDVAVDSGATATATAPAMSSSAAVYSRRVADDVARRRFSSNAADAASAQASAQHPSKSERGTLTRCVKRLTEGQVARQERLEREGRDLEAVGDGAKANDAEGEEVEHGEARDEIVRRRGGSEVREHGLRKGRVELHYERQKVQ